MNRRFAILVAGVTFLVPSFARADPNGLLPRPPRPPPKAGGDPTQPHTAEITPGSLPTQTVTPTPELKPVAVQPGKLETQNLSNAGTAQADGAPLQTNTVWQTTPPPTPIIPAPPPPNLWSEPQRPNPWTTSLPPTGNPWQSDPRVAPDWWKPTSPAHSWPERTPRPSAK